MAKGVRRGESADYALEPPQRERLWNACKNTEDRFIIGMAMFEGMRVSELAHFNRTWVTEEGHIRIPPSMPCRCAECMRIRKGLWKPKTKAGARTLPIVSQMREVIAEVLSTRPQGIEMSRTGVWYRTKEVLYRAKVKVKGQSSEAFTHALRATAAMMLAEGGISATSLCVFMGWTDIKVAEHYIKLTKLKDAAIKEVRAILG